MSESKSKMCELAYNVFVYNCIDDIPGATGAGLDKLPHQEWSRMHSKSLNLQ